VRVFEPIFRLFEDKVDPFAPRPDYRPPERLLPFVLHYVRQMKWAFWALLVYGFLNAIVEAGLFAFVGRVVDILAEAKASGAAAGGWSAIIAEHGGQLLFMLAVVAILRTLVIAYGALIEEQVIVPGFFTMMRWQSHRHVIAQSLSYFHNDLAGRIAQKVMQGGQAAGDMMIALLQIIWFVVVYAATTFGLLLSLNAGLGALIAVWIALFVAIAAHYIPRIRKTGRDTAEAASVLSGRIVDAYANIALVKLHAGPQIESDHVRPAFEGQHRALKRFTRELSGVRISLTTISGLMMAAIAALALDLWLKDAMSSGEVAFSLALTLRLNLLLGRLMGNLNGFFRAVGTVQNTMETVARPIGLLDAPDAKPLLWKEGRIEFRSVSFDYGGDRVIDRLDLVIEPGEKLGIVGPSGAGKSTMVNLLLRFFEPQTGTILIDSQDIGRVTQDSLRACFSLVQQDPALFNRSVADNISHGRPGATIEQIMAAAKKAHAHSFIVKLRDGAGRTGYEARVGERGVKLSGGERQRIAIARVILRDAPVLILDEATSQLDSESEAAIRENLAQLIEGKTVIAIAHRLSTLSEMDRLIVIDAGRIVEQGTHSQLRQSGGLYASLWERQSGGFLPERA
jgi:ATP-binding cassette subfamily B multidrug efflux pump